MMDDDDIRPDVDRKAKALAQAKNIFAERQTAYRAVFDPNGARTAAVLRDLARFCRAHASTFHADARIHAVLEGRREVWLRIQKHLNLTSDELWAIHEKEVRS